MTTTTVTPYRAALTPLSDIVATVTDWAAPSPCEGWSALDVLDHVLTTQRALLTARGLTLPPPADLAADPVAAWAAHAATVAGLASQTLPGPVRPGKLRLMALTVT